MDSPDSISPTPASPDQHIQRAEIAVGPLTDIERAFLQELSGHSPPFPDEHLRPVRSVVLGWALTESGFHESPKIRSMRIRNISISDSVDLQDACVPTPVEFVKCSFKGKIEISNLSIPRLEFIGGEAKDISATRIKVSSVLSFGGGFICRGSITLKDADIGMLSVGRAQLHGRDGQDPAADRRIALNADGIQAGRISLVGEENGHLEITGEVSFFGCTVASHFECTRSHLRNPGKLALGLGGAKIGGRASIRGVGLTPTACGPCIIEGQTILHGAMIASDLDCSGGIFKNPDGMALGLDGAKIQGRVFLRNGFTADGSVTLRAAEIGPELDCNDGTFYSRNKNEANNGALVLARTNVKGTVRLCGGFNAIGGVIAPGMRIGGDLDCSGGAKFQHSGDALLLNGSEIGGRLLCSRDVAAKKDFLVVGCLRMTATHIKGSIELIGANLSNDTGPTISARGLTGGRSAHLRSIKANGPLELAEIDIAGDLDLSDAMLSGRGSINIASATALDLRRARIKGDLLLKAREVAGAAYLDSAVIGGTLDTMEAKFKGLLSLERARSTTLADSGESWPATGRLALSGFVYEAFGGAELTPKGAAQRLDWIARQKEHGGASQVYEQLISVLRRLGHERDAQVIAIAKQRALRDTGLRKGFPPYLWSFFLDVTVGYGYKQSRPVYFLMALLIIGSAVFGIAQKRGLISPVGERSRTAATLNVWRPPPFAPLMYSAELLIPALDLGQKTEWIMHGGPGARIYWIYRWIHTLLGWSAAILLALSPTKLLRKD
ncbi:MAG: putative rane-associated oxidoreductase [Rhodoferax sp.]|nr:putative rane-associated oxidoreductase [Rhodoferax sp.]